MPPNISNITAAVDLGPEQSQSQFRTCSMMHTAPESASESKCPSVPRSTNESSASRSFGRDRIAEPPTAASYSSTSASSLCIYTPKTKENSRGKATAGKGKAAGQKKASNLRKSVPRLSRQEDRLHPDLSQRAAKRRKKRESDGKHPWAINWAQDREIGGPSSEEVLIEWLKIEGNYARYQKPPKHTDDVAFGGEDEKDSEDDGEGDDWHAREDTEREGDGSEEGELSEGAKIIAAISNSIPALTAMEDKRLNEKRQFRKENKELKMTTLSLERERLAEDKARHDREEQALEKHRNRDDLTLDVHRNREEQAMEE
ncbi:hypothetical protein I305_01001 [Cryptococcus gattii E566]|uniref:INO80 complex subunit B-like conserved region domain-containing protein n=1 Tax=Cryptococcus gattii EJB2 TaxID=1296103 RepID=A0ABR5BNC4_9TREE|nr:hypothetical protein I306_05889 [Cryptococcus gattii EJB2]KIY36147.1 hypothetical protein I305_01001 [Cryptococcus gattii E566]KJD99802.1 hypothetical protein I311_06619 [Cryptococcus gattii NT-10]